MLNGMGGGIAPENRFELLSCLDGIQEMVLMCRERMPRSTLSASRLLQRIVKKVPIRKQCLSRTHLYRIRQSLVLSSNISLSRPLHAISWTLLLAKVIGEVKSTEMADVK